MYRYLREDIGLLAATAPTLARAVEVVADRAFVILDGTLLRTDRVGTSGGQDRRYHSGNTSSTRRTWEVVTEPAVRLTSGSDALPGARRDMGAA